MICNQLVEIRRNSDNVISKRIWENFEWHNGSTYWWSEGNMACDCNRALEFDRGVGTDEADEYKCGDGKYSVRITNSDTGNILYKEFD